MYRLNTLVILILAVCCCQSLSADQLPLYIGTGGDGIYLAQFDTENGTLTPPTKVAETPRPTFIWIHPPTNQLYSVAEMKSDAGAAISSWKIDSATGALTSTSRQDAHGDGPCFVAVAGNGKYAAIANYGGGSVSLFPLNDDGTIREASATIQHSGSSVNKRRQREPHAHSSRFDPSDQRVLAADLGTDKVYLYDVVDGSLTTSQPSAISLPPGSGPRHFVFSPDDKYLLVLGELNGTITTSKYAPPSVETVETISTMAAGTPGDASCGSAEILFHPSGQWVYCTNRGPNEIAVFDYNRLTGKLVRSSSVPSGGVHPRNFRISPDGRFLLCANQKTNNIVVFAIDQSTGALTKTATDLAVDQPMCLKFFMPE